MRLLKRKEYNEQEVIVGLQQCNRRIEDWFYAHAKSYFNEHFNEVFFDKDRKQEIFQTAVLKLWTEIHDGKITLLDGIVSRQQRTGKYQPMTCSLTTFLMAFAKNEYREVLRNVREDNYAELFDEASDAVVNVTFEDEVEEQDLKCRIVDDCIQTMSPRCIEVLTLFYYENKSLDEIMEVRSDKNSSKNGLKTAKNKCLTTLREKVISEFKRFNLNI